MKGNDEVVIDLSNEYKLIFNKNDQKFQLSYNGKNLLLNESTELNIDNVEIVCDFYSLLDERLKLNFRDITDGQKEIIFKFFEKANEYLLKKTEDQDIKKYLSNNVFYYKIDNRYDCLEVKNYKREKKYEMYFNKYPRWFSLFGGLNFDYDYFLKCPEEPLCYFKLDETGQEQFKEKRSDLIQTRNNNGWIVKDGWIDKVGNSCCNCDNNKADINIDDSIDSETWKKSAI